MFHNTQINAQHTKFTNETISKITMGRRRYCDAFKAAAVERVFVQRHFCLRCGQRIGRELGHSAVVDRSFEGKYGALFFGCVVGVGEHVGENQRSHGAECDAVAAEAQGVGAL